MIKINVIQTMEKIINKMLPNKQKQNKKLVKEKKTKLKLQIKICLNKNSIVKKGYIIQSLINNYK